MTRPTPSHPLRFDPERYEGTAFRNRGGAAVSELELSGILELSSVGAGSLVLEIGMGTGRIARRLASEGAHVIGIDLDLRMLKHSRRRGAQRRDLNPEDPQVLVASGEHLPFRADVFSNVVCVRVFRYFENSRDALAEIRRVLGPDGRLVLESANMFRPESLTQLPRYLVNRSVYPRLFTRKIMVKWLNEVGLQTIEIRGWHKVPVEIMISVNSAMLAKILSGVDDMMQRLSPPEFLSRSLVILANKPLCSSSQVNCQPSDTAS